MRYLMITIMMLLAWGTSAPKVNAEVSSADIERGKSLTFGRKKGNCLACHVIADGTLPGNSGPPLVAMKARFPDREKLKEQIFDARKRNANTIMPPFGAHEILTAEELERVVDYIYSL